MCLVACSSSLDDSSPSARHVFVLASSSGLRGHKRTYPTILKSADHALFKMVRYVLLRTLRPELDAKTKTCLAEGELSSRLDEQAIHMASGGVRPKCSLNTPKWAIPTPNIVMAIMLNTSVKVDTLSKRPAGYKCM
jgi:hypothetical protein